MMSIKTLTSILIILTLIPQTHMSPRTHHTNMTILPRETAIGFLQHQNLYKSHSSNKSSMLKTDDLARKSVVEFEEYSRNNIDKNKYKSMGINYLIDAKIRRKKISTEADGDVIKKDIKNNIFNVKYGTHFDGKLMIITADTGLKHGEGVKHKDNYLKPGNEHNGHLIYNEKAEIKHNIKTRHNQNNNVNNNNSSMNKNPNNKGDIKFSNENIIRRYKRSKERLLTGPYNTTIAINNDVIIQCKLTNMRYKMNKINVNNYSAHNYNHNYDNYNENNTNDENNVGDDNDEDSVEWSINDFHMGPGKLQKDLEGFSYLQDGTYPRYMVYEDKITGLHKLKILNVTLEDETWYRCQAVPRGTFHGLLSLPSYLTVLVPPKDLILKNMPIYPSIYFPSNHQSSIHPSSTDGQNVNSLDMLEGQFYKFECRSTHNKPSSEIVWKLLHASFEKTLTDNRQTVRIDIREEASTKDSRIVDTISTLTLKASQSMDLHTLSCSSMHLSSRGYVFTRTIVLNVLYKPIIHLHQEPKTGVLHEGSRLIIKCQVDSKPSSHNITWLLNDNDLTKPYTNNLILYNKNNNINNNGENHNKWIEKNHNGIANNMDNNNNNNDNNDNMNSIKTTKNTLIFENLHRSLHQGKVKCRASNSIGSSSAHIILSILYGPSFRQTATTDTWLYKQTSAILDCGDVISHPPAKIEWFKSKHDYRNVNYVHEGENLNEDKAQFLVKINHEGRELNVRPEKDSDFGYFFCRAFVKGFPAAYKEFLVGKKSKPIITSSTIQYGSTGSNAKFTCSVVGVPRPDSIVWMKNGNVIKDDHRLRITKKDTRLGSESYLTIGAFETADVGSYACFANNSIGHSQKNINIQKKELVPFYLIIIITMVGLVFIFVLIILIILIKRIKNREKIDGKMIVPFKNNSTSPSQTSSESTHFNTTLSNKKNANKKNQKKDNKTININKNLPDVSLQSNVGFPLNPPNLIECNKNNNDLNNKNNKGNPTNNYDCQASAFTPPHQTEGYPCSLENSMVRSFNRRMKPDFLKNTHDMTDNNNFFQQSQHLPTFSLQQSPTSIVSQHYNSLRQPKFLINYQQFQHQVMNQQLPQPQFIQQDLQNHTNIYPNIQTNMPLYHHHHPTNCFSPEIIQSFDNCGYGNNNMPNNINIVSTNNNNKLNDLSKNTSSLQEPLLNDYFPNFSVCRNLDNTSFNTSPISIEEFTSIQKRQKNNSLPKTQQETQSPHYVAKSSPFFTDPKMSTNV